MAAPTPQPTSVFISYSRADSATIDRMEAELISYGFRTWVDRGHLEGGDKWVAQIERAIQASDVVVAGLSPEAIASPWVTNELLYAQQLGKSIIPTLLRPVASIPIFLISLQYIDMHANESQGLQQLRARLLRLGEQAAAVPERSELPKPPPAVPRYGGRRAPQRTRRITPSPSRQQDAQPSTTDSERANPPCNLSDIDLSDLLERFEQITNTAKPRLVVSEGKEPRRNYEIHKDRMTIGRMGDSDIFLEDFAVSRLHATINRQSDGYYLLRDENSANGTLVNGKRVSDYLLEDGDVIQIGETLLVFYS